MIEELLNHISTISTPGFFITAEVSKEGKDIPRSIQTFISEKLSLIYQGINGRKFIYQDANWRITFTFFPTDKVVDEKYALKNKVLFKHK